MQFILEENDIKYIERINQDIDNIKDLPLYLNQYNRKYCIEFECTDIAKANSFVVDLMNPRNEEKLNENLGIRICSIRYDNNRSILDNLKTELRTLLEKLDQMQEKMIYENRLEQKYPHPTK